MPVCRQQPGDFVATVGCVRRYALRVQPLVVAVCWKRNRREGGPLVGTKQAYLLTSSVC